MKIKSNWGGTALVLSVVVLALCCFRLELLTLGYLSQHAGHLTSMSLIIS
jgi:hypothetical protein